MLPISTIYIEYSAQKIKKKITQKWSDLNVQRKNYHMKNDFAIVNQSSLTETDSVLSNCKEKK